MREIDAAKVGADEAQPVEVAAVHVLREAAADARVDELAHEIVFGGRRRRRDGRGQHERGESERDDAFHESTSSYAGAWAPVRSA